MNDRITTNVKNTYEVGNEAVYTAFDELNTPDGGQGFGCGIAYDVISDSGVDFSRQAWGMQMQCGLTTDNPHGCYLFAHSKQTIAYNSTGLQVMQ
jgi:hypothetical protein